MGNYPLKKLAKSKKDRWIGGVCGGFGEHTPIPSWLYRVFFVILFFFSGVGLFAYVLLWIFMPKGE